MMVFPPSSIWYTTTTVSRQNHCTSRAVRIFPHHSPCYDFVTRECTWCSRENLIMWLKYHHCHMKNHSNTQRSNTGTWRIFWHVHACLWCYHLVMAIRRRWRRWYVTVFVRSKSVGEKIIFLLSHHENITHLKHSNTPMLYNTGTPVGIMSSIVTSLFSMLKCDEKPRIKAAVRALHTTFRCVFYGTWCSSDL